MGCASSTEKSTVEGLRSPADDRKSGSSSEDTNDQPANEFSGRLCSQKTEEAGPLTVRQLQIIENKSGPAGEAILEVVCSTFNVESSCVAVNEHHDRVFFWAGSGMCKTGSHSIWAQQFTNWVLSTSSHEIIIIEDASTDARVKDSPMVCVEPGIRFFAAAPLVASNGTCIGAMCVFDNRVRSCDAVEASVLAGMAEVAVRAMEASWAAQHAHARGLVRPPAAFTAATMLVDASQFAWKVLHLNAAVTAMTGISAHMASASSFWALFSCGEVAGGEQPWASYTEPVEGGRPFTVRSAQRRGSSIHTTFSLTFTPVMSTLDEHAVPIGIPCAAALQPNAHRYYFVNVQPEAEADACSAAATATGAAAAAPLPGLELGPLLAKSTYGRTYRAFYNGTPVAVKVVSNGRRNLRYRDGRPLCAALSEGLKSSSAPIVRTLAHACHYSRTLLHKAAQGKGGAGGEDAEAAAICIGDEDGRSLCEMSDSACSLQDGEAANSASTHQTWLVQEYCGLGTLHTAIERGKFHRSSGRVDAMTVLAVADDIASGMTFLHSHGVLHGNLSSASVLLAFSQKAAHGFKAKVSDWGMLRELDTRGFASQQKYPCLSHLAPEVLLRGTMSKAADVYSLGVLVWEMAAGRRLWAELSWSQAMAAATLKHARPRTPRHRCTPAGLESLARLCMAFDPENRPSFEEVKRIVRAMRTGCSGDNLAADMRLLQKVDLSCEELRNDHLISLGLGGVRVRGAAPPARDIKEVTSPHAVPDGALYRRISEDGSDAALDGPRPRGALRKVSLSEARGSQPPAKPKPAALNLALPNISAAIEEAARESEPGDAQPLAQPPSDHKAAAWQLWQFRKDRNLRSLDPAAHGEWSRVSLCEPPPHLKHLINAGKVNHAGQPPPGGGVPCEPSPSHDRPQQPRMVRRSVDVRRSIAGRGMRTGAADRVAAAGRSAPRDLSPRDAVAKLPGVQESPAGSPPAQCAGAVSKELLGEGIGRNSAAKEKPSQRVSFSGGNRVSFERGLDALRSSLHESPAVELLALQKAPVPSASSTGGEADHHDLHSIGRKLPRVRVTLPQ
ncbi:probable serine/threonine-protein kinase STY8 at C-terminar half [Coccomyxa sp. Obi]|nr:probable serine/threonine-protein kinase STY8 at C-terminar half [Coccomyxa sp. Obi]